MQTPTTQPQSCTRFLTVLNRLLNGLARELIGVLNGVLNGVSGEFNRRPIIPHWAATQVPRIE